MNNLKKLREKKGVYQKDVAAYLGVDRTTYVKYENGDSEPNFEMLRKLADYFGVTTDDILGRKEKTPENGTKKMRNRVSELRKQRGWTQKDLAGMLGVAQNTLSYWEQGKYDIDSESLGRIAEIFGVSIDYLLCLDDKKNLSSAPNILSKRKGVRIVVLKEIRKQRNMSQAELAKKIGVSRSTVAMWEIDASQPNNTLLLKLSQALGVTLDELLENHSSIPGLFPIKTKKVPLLRDISCGEPVFDEEQQGALFSASDDLDVDFCLRAVGDSMIGARIRDGDVVFIRSQPEVNNGQIAAVLIGNEATLKRVYYYPEKQKLVLSPENPAFEPLVYVGRELEEVRILGLAVAFQSRVK